MENTGWLQKSFILTEKRNGVIPHAKKEGCNKKLELDSDGFLACEKCGRRYGEGILRYRVKVRVVDRDGNAPLLLWDRECEQLVGVPATVLHERHPTVFPHEILALKSLSMAFWISIRKQQFHNMHNAFGVMQILNDPALVDAHCPELLEESENEDNDKQLLDAEDDEEEFVSNDEVQNPITQQDSTKDFTQSGSGLVKRNLLDGFSSTQTSKKTKETPIKKEKLS
nr:uncharacterized protein LOC109190185 [Ipomoea trifida]